MLHSGASRAVIAARLCALVLGHAAATGAPFDSGVWRDTPMASTSLQYLDSEVQNWTVSRWDGVLTVPASVPGDLISDLQAASVIGDPIYELTFLDGVWDDGNWTYSTSFALAPDIAARITAGAAAGSFLVLESAKMVADVSLNDAYLGFVANQYVRYSFPVQQLLKPAGLNSLQLTFHRGSDPRLVEGRITGAGGGWDWGPIRRFVSAADPPRAGGNGVPDDTSMSRGLVRSLYLLQSAIGVVTINQTVPLVYYRGQYATTPLSDATAGPWLVTVDVHLSNAGPAALTGVQVAAQGAWGTGNATAIASLPVGDSVVTLLITVPAGAVKLWWTADTAPLSRRGQPQPLYNVSIAVTTPAAAVTDTRRIGFRSFVQVTADDSDPASLAGVDGSGNLTMRFKLNGANIFSRGADIIPMEWLEGRQSSAAYRRMVTSAIEGGYNTLRIDGIDTYFPDAFYDACDEAVSVVHRAGDVALPGRTSRHTADPFPHCGCPLAHANTGHPAVPRHAVVAGAAAARRLCLAGC